MQASVIIAKGYSLTASNDPFHLTRDAISNALLCSRQRWFLVVFANPELNPSLPERCTDLASIPKVIIQSDITPALLEQQSPLTPGSWDNPSGQSSEWSPLVLFSHLIMTECYWRGKELKLWSYFPLLCSSLEWQQAVAGAVHVLF